MHAFKVQEDEFQMKYVMKLVLVHYLQDKHQWLGDTTQHMFGLVLYRVNKVIISQICSTLM